MRWLVTITLAWLVAGCAPKPPGERFYGTWSVKNRETLALDPAVSALSAEARQRLQKVTAKWMKSVRFTFERNGQLTIVFANARSAYTFKIKRVDPDALVLTVSEKANAQGQPMTLTYIGKGMEVRTGQQRWALERD